MLPTTAYGFCVLLALHVIEPVVALFIFVLQSVAIVVEYTVLQHIAPLVPI